MNDEAVDPGALYIYLHTSGLPVRVARPAAVPVAALSRLQPALLSAALLKLLGDDPCCVFGERVPGRGGQVLPYAHHLSVFVPVGLDYKLHGAWRAPPGGP